MSSSTSSKVSPEDSRVNVLLRLVGLLFVALGVATTVLTYSEALAADLVPQVVPVFYLTGGMLIVVGLIAMIARYR